jgi:hypothetical protein
MSILGGLDPDILDQAVQALTDAPSRSESDAKAEAGS